MLPWKHTPGESDLLPTSDDSLLLAPLFVRMPRPTLVQVEACAQGFEILP